MIVEIDQSGRTDQLNKPTALALSNGIKKAVYISSKEKRKIFKSLKASNPTWSKHRICYNIFNQLLFVLLKDCIYEIDTLIIDPEYPGYEGDIKNRILSKLAITKKTNPSIIFKSVGRKSNAHKLAWLTYKGKKRGTTVNKNEIIRKTETYKR